MSQADTTVVAELVAKAIEVSEGDISRVDFDAVCADHPELQSDVIEGVRVALTLPGLHAEGDVDRLSSQILADRYRLDERLGAGAMGVVYRATDLDLGRELAIKVMQTSLLERSTALARFEREAAALAAVQHPAVVTIYDRGVTPDGTSYLAMELIEGVPCSRILELARDEHSGDDSTAWLREECGLETTEETSFLRQVMRWAADVAAGLTFAHAAGVVHRDVKPSNIVIRPNGKAVLLDFGIAAKEDQETLTQTGAAVGTPAYMAPEALTGGKDAKPSQDVWGLAATLYHMLTLQAPYKGGAHEVLAAIATREPVPAAKIRPGIPRDAQAILDHGLARDPRSRYSSLAAMESDLRNLLAYKPVGVRPTTAVTRLWRRAKRSRTVIGAVLASILILAVQAGRQTYSDLRFDRIDSFYRAWAVIPANFGLVKNANRDIPNAALFEQASAAFDSLVASRYQPIVARTLRAAFRWDHGDGDGASADMDAVAAAAGSEYAKALAERYRERRSAAHQDASVDTSSLPEPVTRDDAYLAMFHAARVRDWSTAMNLLSDERLEGHIHAEELSLLMSSLPLRSLKATEAGELVNELYMRAQELLLERPHGSALISHVIGTACVWVNLYPAALEHSERSFGTAPASFPPLENAAAAALHDERPLLALEYADRVEKLLPGYSRSTLTKIRALTALERFEEARALVATHASSLSSSKALDLTVTVDLAEARTFAEEDPERSRTAAEHALRAIESATDCAEYAQEQRSRVESYARADLGFEFLATLDELRTETLSVPLLAQLVSAWPENRLDRAQRYLSVARQQLIELQVRRGPCPHVADLALFTLEDAAPRSSLAPYLIAPVKSAWPIGSEDRFQAFMEALSQRRASHHVLPAALTGAHRD